MQDNMYVTRFELATFWSVARRSIQLSYTYMIQNVISEAIKYFMIFSLYDITIKHMVNAGNGNRTRMGVKSRRILSPVRLPVPPHRHNNDGTNRARTYDPLLVRQMLSQLSYDPTY